MLARFFDSVSWKIERIFEELYVALYLAHRSTPLPLAYTLVLCVIYTHALFLSCKIDIKATAFLSG